MIHRVPPLTSEASDRLHQLDRLRADLGRQLRAPTRWTGTLRRLARADVARFSTGIEGFQVSPAAALAIVEETPTVDASERDRQALHCYREAMDWVLTIASDPDFQWSPMVIKTLHFLACRFQNEAQPGQWRTIAVGIGGPEGPHYEGAPSAAVAGLMGEVVTWLATEDRGLHPVVRGAMAHLHVVSIHPFRDGNGRVSRIVQSLVLAREGILSPDFASIERYLGEHTPAYYQALHEAQGPTYDPMTDTSPWVEFAITAHLEEALALQTRLDLAWARFSFCEEIVQHHGWPERSIHALDAALAGIVVRNEDYRKEHGISSVTAANDLRLLVDAGLLILQGQGRGAHYLAGPAFIDRWQAVQRASSRKVAGRTTDLATRRGGQAR